MSEEKGAITKSTKYRLKKLVSMLDGIRGRHTELVTVYVPAGYSLNEISTQLSQEQGTAENIKSKPVRKNVTTALDKIIRHLQLYKKTPDNGLAIFCGNVSEKEGFNEIDMWTIEPPEPVKVKMYWCDQKFIVDPLKDMVEEKDIYGIITLDKSEADMAILKGKKMEPLQHFESIVPGKTRAGGQCLLPETLVQLSSGEIMEIKDVHNPLSVKSASFDDFTLSDSPVMDKWDAEKTTTYRIITKLPMIEIKSSADHLFFTWGDEIKERPASELKAGDYLLMPERVQIKGELQALNSAILYNSYKISEEGRNLIIQKRKILGISQKELAKRLGVTQTGISVIELNKRDIRLDFLHEICRNLGIEFDSFIRNYCIPKTEIKLPEILDERLAQLLGYFAGDGSFEKERLSFHEKDEKTIRSYHSLTKNLFNCNTHIRFRENKGFWVLRVHGKPIVRLLKNEFPELKGYSDTEIPKKVLKSGDSVLACFLRGLFDAEGYVNTERGIGLGINNKKLAKQIQIALLRFSILASLNEYDNRRNPYTKETRFTINVTEKESLNNFHKCIGFSVPYKSRKLGSALKNKSSTSYVRRIVVSGKNVRKLLEQNGMKISDFPKVTNFFRNERLIGKEVFQNSILKEVKNKELYGKLKAIMEYNLVPVKVHKIEKTESAVKMVDISVKNQNFVANGLFVHNSSARFSRVREGLLNDWFKEIGEASNKIFEQHPEVIGILVGGPGPIKDMFLKEDYLHEKVRHKVLGTVDTSYTGEYGLHETIERGSDLLKEAAVVREKKLIQRFFEELQKPHGLAVHGLENSIKSIEAGMADTVIVTDKIDLKEMEYECDCGITKKFVQDFYRNKQTCEKGHPLKILGEKDVIEALEERANNYGTKLEIVSADTREGQQFFALSGIGVFLRYRV